MSTFRVTARMFAKSRQMFPEMAEARANRSAIARKKAGRQILSSARKVFKSLYPIPRSTYTQYRQFLRNGGRSEYERPHFQQGRNFSAACMLQFLDPSPEHLDAVQDYIWDICEQTTWIAPAHELGGVDLMATEQAFSLAEACALLEGELSEEVVQRVHHEVERQVFTPFEKFTGGRRARRLKAEDIKLSDLVTGERPHHLWFFKGRNNWNGVCCSSIGAALLYLEESPRRLARLLNRLLESLEVFLKEAFCEDGASDEGAGYWQYGLVNFVAFAELLRRRTGGKVDLLRHPKLKKIASFPLGVYLSPERFYNHADCSPRLTFYPGVVGRLAERTGVEELKGLVASRVGAHIRLPMSLRNLLWWNGRVGAEPKVCDRLFPDAGIFRMASGRLVVAGKAGHNSENHNHNDVGSFVVHVDGEDLLCDPGAPSYNRDFFSDKRYTHFFHTQSRGHNCPVIGGRMQEHGRRYRGKVVSFRNGGPRHSVEMEFSAAYPLKTLKSLKRRLEIGPANRIELEDHFRFSGRGVAVEEGFVTWMPVTVRGATATIRGEKSVLRLRVTEPQGAKFRLEEKELDSKTLPGKEKGMLRRLSVALPKGRRGHFVMEGRVRKR